MTVRSLRSLPELAIYEGVVCTSQHFVPGIWQNREFVLECISDPCLDPRTSFSPDRVSLQSPLASVWPVRGQGRRKGCKVATGGCVETQSTRGLSGTPLGRPMAPEGAAGVLGWSLALARGHSGVELATGGWGVACSDVRGLANSPKQRVNLGHNTS